MADEGDENPALHHDDDHATTSDDLYGSSSYAVGFADIQASTGADDELICAALNTTVSVREVLEQVRGQKSISKVNTRLVWSASADRIQIAAKYSSISLCLPTCTLI